MACGTYSLRPTQKRSPTTNASIFCRISDHQVTPSLIKAERSRIIIVKTCSNTAVGLKSRLSLEALLGLAESEQTDFVEGLEEQGVLLVHQLRRARDHSSYGRERADRVPRLVPAHHHPVLRAVQSAIAPS
ncbi:uncharacterized protein J3R85_019499 [Psidium guajava]|nr:uncharacterized protein J3R85_019499 [Psidium guajava]